MPNDFSCFLMVDLANKKLSTKKWHFLHSHQCYVKKLKEGFLIKKNMFKHRLEFNKFTIYLYKLLFFFYYIIKPLNKQDI